MNEVCIINIEKVVKNSTSLEGDRNTDGYPHYIFKERG